MAGKLFTKADATKISPTVGAITVGLSFFVGLMSLLVMVMAFAVAGRQSHPHVHRMMGWSDVEAARLSWLIGVLALINSFVAFGRARLRPWVTMGCTAVFFITVFMTNALFLRAW